MDEKLKKIIGDRDFTVGDLNKRLEASVSGAQKKLLEKFMEDFVYKLKTDDKGVIINNVYNRNLLNSLDNLFTEFTKKNAPILLNEIISGVGSIVNFNSKYFSNFEPESKLLPIRNKVKQSVAVWLGVEDGSASKNGYLNTLIENDTSRNMIKNIALKSVLSQDGYEKTKASVKSVIDGDGESLGAMQKYYRNFTYDLYSQVDRATAKTYADDLKFEFAIYEGGLIKTSRPFCKDHNGKVYHKSEILAFKLPSAEPPDYNPFFDLGGYGCRHHLNWVPNALAFALRPDARKFLEDNKNKPEEKPKPAVKPKPDPKPKKSPIKTPEEMFKDYLKEENKRAIAPLTDYQKEAGIKLNTKFLDLFTRAIPLKRTDKGGAFYSPSDKTVTIPTTDRYKREYYAEKIVYHEFGHVLDWQHNLRQNPIVVDGMKSIRKLFAKDKSARYKEIDKEVRDIFKHVQEKKADGTRGGWDPDKSEMLGAIADTLMALNPSYGYGHSKAYFKRPYLKEAEFIAHAFEIKYGKNPLFDEIAPDLKKEMVRILDELLKTIKE